MIQLKPVSQFRNSSPIFSLTSYSTGNNTVDVSLVVSYSDSTANKTILLASPVITKGTKIILKGNLGDVLKETLTSGFEGIIEINDNWKEEIITF